MSFFLVLLAVIVAAAVVFYVLGLRRSERRLGDGAAPMPEGLMRDSLRPAVPSKPAVLLPEVPRAADVAAVRFSVALRGYRPDQVDEVLDTLAEALRRSEERVAQLEAAAAPEHDAGRQESAE